MFIPEFNLKSMENYSVKAASIEDCQQIFELYKAVSKSIGGIARTQDEITFEYINYFTRKALDQGLQFIIKNNDDSTIIGELHCYKLEPMVFDHILSELTIVIHPDYQSIGLGKKLFEHLLYYVEKYRQDILRIELIARESNLKAISLYECLGFEKEGKLKNRIKVSDTVFESDIPMGWINKNYENKE